MLIVGDMLNGIVVADFVKLVDDISLLWIMLLLMTPLLLFM